MPQVSYKGIFSQEARFKLNITLDCKFNIQKKLIN